MIAAVGPARFHIAAGWNGSTMWVLMVRSSREHGGSPAASDSSDDGRGGRGAVAKAGPAVRAGRRLSICASVCCGRWWRSSSSGRSGDENGAGAFTSTAAVCNLVRMRTLGAQSRHLIRAMFSRERPEARSAGRASEFRALALFLPSKARNAPASTLFSRLPRASRPPRPGRARPGEGPSWLGS
jgi:hypothetical protein